MKFAATLLTKTLLHLDVKRSLHSGMRYHVMLTVLQPGTSRQLSYCKNKWRTVGFRQTSGRRFSASVTEVR